MIKNLVCKQIKGFAYYRNDRKLLIKPVSLSNENMLMSIYPIKGKSGIKNEYVTVLKNGFLVIELIPYLQEKSKSKQIEWSKKISFALISQNIGSLLQINNYTMQTQDINMKIQYELNSKFEEKTLFIKKLQHENTLKFTIENVSTSQNGVIEEKSHTFEMQISDFLMIRQLCKFSLPYLVGWNMLDINNSQELDDQIM